MGPVSGVQKSNEREEEKETRQRIKVQNRVCVVSLYTVWEKQFSKKGRKGDELRKR